MGFLKRRKKKSGNGNDNPRNLIGFKYLKKERKKERKKEKIKPMVMAVVCQYL